MALALLTTASSALCGTAGAATPTKSHKTSTKRSVPVTSGGAGLGGPVSAPVTAPVTVPSTPVHPTVVGYSAKIIRGVAYAPSYAPIQVQKAIWAGNAIRFKPYLYGGGHGTWHDTGYDCSGSVSYVLHAAGLLSVSKDSSDFMSWGQTGLGQWITVYTNPDHAFVEIAGIRLDTSAEGDAHPASGSGPRWRRLLQDISAFMPRHLENF
jgi:cell wall-associated NlpC family hydrolase